MDDVEEIDQNTLVGDLTLEQFRKILCEELGKAVKIACKNILENHQAFNPEVKEKENQEDDTFKGYIKEVEKMEIKGKKKNFSKVSSEGKKEDNKRKRTKGLSKKT
ncbi:UNVERIFIED_CONTAM: hypothetical protein K2H54_026908 [Gekko kuhli]